MKLNKPNQIIGSRLATILTMIMMLGFVIAANVQALDVANDVPFASAYSRPCKKAGIA